MQGSATRHSPRISMEPTASLVPFGTASGMIAVATCTGGVSGGGVCEGSANAASTIVFGSSGAAAVSVAVNDSATVAVSTARSTLSATTLLIAVAGPASAVRGADWRSLVATALLHWVTAEPKPTRQATNAVSHSTAATVAHRRGFTIPVSKCSA